MSSNSLPNTSLPDYVRSGVPTPVENWLGNTPKVSDDLYNQPGKYGKLRTSNGSGLGRGGGSGFWMGFGFGGGGEGIVVIILFAFVIVGAILYAFIISPFMNVKLVKDMKEELKDSLNLEQEDKMDDLVVSSYLGAGAGFVLLIILTWFFFDYNNWKRAKRGDNKKIYNLIDNLDQNYISEIKFTEPASETVTFSHVNVNGSVDGSVIVNTEHMYPDGGAVGFITPSLGMRSDS